MIVIPTIVIGMGLASLGIFGVQAAWGVELFGVRNRYTKMAFAKKLGSSIWWHCAAGGICILSWTGHWWPIAVYFIAMACIGLVTTFFAPETRGRDLNLPEDDISMAVYKKSEWLLFFGNVMLEKGIAGCQIQMTVSDAGRCCPRSRTSVAVVSYVINNGPRPVAEQRGKGVSSNQKNGVSAKWYCKALASGSTQTYGLVIPDISNPFLAIAHALQREAFKYGHVLLLGDAGILGFVKRAD